MDLGLDGAKAVVTGGSKGMGRAIAERLAGEGAQVAVVARGREALDATVAALHAAGSAGSFGLAVDVTDRDQVDAAFLELDRTWGSLNVLVNTLGPGAGRFEQLDDSDWDASFDLGVMAAVRCVRAGLPLLRQAEWARIVNVSAHSTQRQSPLIVAYTAAKAALTSVSKNLSKSLAPEGILVNTVSPGIHRHRQLQRGAAGAVRTGRARRHRSLRRHDLDRPALPPAGRPGPGRAARGGGLPHRLPGLPDQRLRDRRRRQRRRRIGLHLMMDADALVEAAVVETGLEDFGGTSWREGLDRLVTSLNAEATLTQGGEEILGMRLGMLLSNRLRIVDTITTHPEITDEEVVGPLVIIGLPRTGTTALSNLLAADPQIRSIRLWESTEPVPPPESATQASDPRIESARRGLDAMYEAFPKMRSLHFQAADGPTECQDLLGMDFRTAHFDGMARVPAYSAWVLGCDMAGTYAFHRRVLQLLQWHCPPRFWHLKTPVHMLALDDLRRAYPGASSSGPTVTRPRCWARSAASSPIPGAGSAIVTTPRSSGASSWRSGRRPSGGPWTSVTGSARSGSPISTSTRCSPTRWTRS